MTAKLMTILLALGLTSLALLGHRQQRIDTAHEMARLHRRCDEIRTSLWDIRSQIANIVRTLPAMEVPRSELADTMMIPSNELSAATDSVKRDG